MGKTIFTAENGDASPLTNAVDFALACYRDPLACQSRLASSTQLPTDMDLLLSVASGSIALLDDEACRTGVRPEEILSATRFLIQQICFCRGASHYRVLGLEPGAPLEKIKERHRRLISLYHPDRATGGRTWTDHYAARINQAWSVLSRPQSKSVYDIQFRCADASFSAPTEHEPDRIRYRVSINRQIQQAFANPRPQCRAGRRLSRFIAPLAFVVVATALAAAIGLMLPFSSPAIYSTTDIAIATDIAAVEIDDLFKLDRSRSAQQPHKEDSAKSAAQKQISGLAVQVDDKGIASLTQNMHDTPSAAHASSLLVQRSIATDELAPGEVIDTMKRYANAYRQGNLEKLMLLFSDEALSNNRRDLSAIRRDYSLLFSSFTIRRLYFYDLYWDLKGSTANVVSRYELWLKSRTSSQSSQLTGTIRFVFQKRNGEVRIATIDIDWPAF